MNEETPLFQFQGVKMGLFRQERVALSGRGRVPCLKVSRYVRETDVLARRFTSTFKDTVDECGIAR